jgi:hypothetical protein
LSIMMNGILSHTFVIALGLVYGVFIDWKSQ